MEKSNTVSIHRVGSITTGVSMILFGVVCALHELRIINDLKLVLKLWPVILIGLGTEMLFYNAKDKHFVYDKGAIILMFVMSGFAVMMAVVEECLKYINI